MTLPNFLIIGAAKLTEAGEQPGNSVANDFKSFEQVFTGADVIIAIWENSTSAVVDPEIPVDNDKDNLGRLIKNFQVGVVRKGLFVEENVNTQFSKTAELDAQSATAQTSFYSVTYYFEN